MIGLLKRGTRNSNVELIQRSLNQLYPLDYPQLSVDGKFGPLTYNWVVKFQRSNGLKVDGIVGPNTITRLRTLLPMSFPQTSVNAAPGVTPLPQNGTPITQPKISTVFYLHSHDVPGKGVTMTKHNAHKTHHLIYTSDVGQKYNGNIFEATLGHINDNNYKLKEFVINAHGFGAGTVSFGNRTIHLGKQTSEFKRLRPYFEPTAHIWIYSCLFANDKIFLDKDGDTNDFDAQFWDGRSVVNHGPGINALKAIAKATQVPVFAGFSLQHGNSGAYIGHYVKVNSHGAFAIFNGTPLRGYTKTLIDLMYGALFG